MGTKTKNSFQGKLSSLLDILSMRYVTYQGEMSNRKLLILFYKSGEKSGLERGLDK